MSYSTDDSQPMGPIRTCQNYVGKHAGVNLPVSVCGRKLCVPALPRTEEEYCIICHQLGKTHRLKDHFYLKYIAFLHSKPKGHEAKLGTVSLFSLDLDILFAVVI